MKRILKNIISINLYAIIIFSFCTIYPQKSAIKNQKAMIDSLNDLAYNLTYSNLDSAFVLARKAEKLSMNLNYDEGLGVAYLTIGNFYYLVSQKDSALFFLDKSEILLQKFKNNNLLSPIFVMKGIIKMESLKYTDANEYFHKSLDLSKQLNDSINIATTFVNIANLFGRLGDYNQELEYLLKAYEIGKNLKSPYISQHCLLDISDSYISKKQYYKALKYINKAKNLNGDINDKEIEAKISSSFSNLYFEQKQYDSALIFINKTLETYKKIGNSSYTLETGILKLKILEKFKHYEKVISFANRLQEKFVQDSTSDLYTQIIYYKGKSYFGLKQYSQAKTSLHAVLLLPQSNDNLSTFRNTYRLLYEIAEVEKNSKEAFKQFKKYASLRDSVNILITKAKSIDFEQLQELNIKEKEIEDLKKDKIIANLKLESQTTYRNFLFIVSILLGTIFIVVTINNFKIRAFNKKLKQLHESEERFLKIISHDIRNSLGAVISFSNLLINNEATLTKKETKDSVSEINKAALAINNLLTNLLQWTLAKNNDLSFNPKIENLKKIVKEGIASSLSLIKIKNLELVINIDNNIKIFIDSYSITSVIRNLLTNAIKFSNPSSKIIITAFVKGNFVYLSVKDSGVGIPEDTLKNLFDDSTHNTSNGTNNEKGTGIGISLIKKFVKMNGGTIKAESQLEKGSTFTFSMPLENKD